MKANGIGDFTGKSFAIWNKKGPATHNHFEDTGCESAPSCLQCPFDLCKYDNPSHSHDTRMERNREIKVMIKESQLPFDAAVLEASKEHRLKERQILRILSGDVDVAERRWRKEHK